ncbi:MAG: DUF2721 domain-containing protein [Candidatus Methylopumilus sp.]|jgi:hypothetical protein
MQVAANLSVVATAIQLAVAPVFLLTGIGALLTVMVHRLARVIDRFRTLKESKGNVYPYKNEEMDILLVRSAWVHWAIRLITMSALLVASVIAALFFGSELKIDPSRVVSVLFIAAMLTLIISLLCFLREIYLSKGAIHKED